MALLTKNYKWCLHEDFPGPYPITGTVVCTSFSLSCSLQRVISCCLVHGTFAIGIFIARKQVVLKDTLHLKILRL